MQERQTRVSRRTETEEREYPIPPEYEGEGNGWKRAFQHAMSYGNTVKAAALYATAHEIDFVAAEDATT